MSLRFTLRQLEYFTAVGEAGSIARAAEAIGVAPPTISASIADLEQEFGLQLFVRRHAQGLSLTTGGRRFFAEARRLLEDASALRALASDITERVSGPLALGCLSTFAMFVLPELRRRFETRFPEVRISQTESHQGVLLDRLRRGEVDLALTYNLDIAADIRFEPLVTLPPFAMLPAEHPLATCQSVGITDLAALPMVLLDLPHSRDYFQGLFRAEGIEPRIGERTTDMALMRSMVANGYGYSISNVRPVSAIAPDNKPLAFVPISGDVRRLDLGVAHTASMTMSRTMAAFVAHCRSAITPEAMPGLIAPGAAPA